MSTSLNHSVAAEGAKRGGPIRSLYNRNYRLLWIASLITISAWMMQMVARGWLILEMTNSPFYVTMVYAAGSLPMLVFTIAGGILADRVERRRIVMANDVAGLFLYALLGLLVLTHTVEVWHVMAISFATGVSFSLSMPSRQAIISNLVDREDLSNAIALSTAMFSASQTVAPAVAGFLVSSIGTAGCFILTSVILVASMLFLRAIKIPEAQTAPRDQNVLRNLKEGFVYTKNNALIASLIIMGAVGTIFAMPYQALMPVMARDVLVVGSQGLGLLLGAVGVGALTASATLAALSDTHFLGKMLLASSLSLGLSVILFALSPIFALALVMAATVGFSMQMFLTTNFTVVQIVVPDGLRGRVLSIRMVIFGMSPIGQLLGGWVSEEIGAPRTLALGGAICIALMLLVIAVSTEIRGSWRYIDRT
ncbi:MAG: permease of the major facilitator superfamily [Dehalococcoidia bacterium]|nr:permease of the major facilitator superfamily [Dehalococcoidia bacterium]